MENCNCCDELKDIPSGNGSIRPAFRQPTMYDHIESFSKHKLEKEHARKLRNTKKQLLKLNPQFTDLQLETKNDEIFQSFSTQDIAKFRSNLREGRLNVETSKIEAAGLWEKHNILDSSVSLLTISRTPIYCPVSKCGQTISMMSVLSHFLSDHNNELLVEYKKLYTGGRSISLFKRDSFAFGENVCMGIVSYGGIESQKISLPAIRGICKSNSFLTKAHSYLENHLPIFVMVCKTSIRAMLDKPLSDELIDCQDEEKQILVIWFVTVQTTKPIYGTITAFDKSMTSSVSTIIQVRSLLSPQNPKEFLSSDTNYLILNHAEMNILSEEATEPIHVEIKIHEFDDLTDFQQTPATNLNIN